MLLRRMLLFASLLLVLGAVASAIAPRQRAVRDRTAPRAAAPAGTTGPPSVATGTLPVVTGTLPGKTVRARIGDLVKLRATAIEPDLAQIDALGLTEPVEADLPADFEFAADQVGRFAVTLSVSGRRLGYVEVSPAP